MTPFGVLTSIAAPMPDADIDTDIIFPARFLLLTDKRGLGRCAFFEKRFTPDGAERSEFVLNRAPWRGAQILVAGPNFGCGSSREQAPWALDDLGIRCIVAPGFGEIFQANCFANGILPVVLPAAAHARVLREAEAGRPITVDLMACTVEFHADPSGDSTVAADAFAETLLFDVPPRQREALLAGLDEIGLIRQQEGARIAEFERRHRARMPWLFTESPAADSLRRP